MLLIEFRDSQKRKLQTGILYRSELGPLHAHYDCVAWCSCGAPNNACACDLPPNTGYLSGLEKRVWAQSYCILFGHGHVQLIFLGSLGFWEGGRGAAQG